MSTRTFARGIVEPLRRSLRSTGFDVVRFPVKRIEARDRVDVDVRRLDSVFSEVARHVAAERVYLKCDTQGLDLEVVDGAGGVLDDLAGLQLELDVEALYHGSASLDDGLALLGSRGYRVAGLFPVARDDRAALLQVEGVFVPAGRTWTLESPR